MRAGEIILGFLHDVLSPEYTVHYQMDLSHYDQPSIELPRRYLQQEAPRYLQQEAPSAAKGQVHME